MVDHCSVRSCQLDTGLYSYSYWPIHYQPDSLEFDLANFAYGELAKLGNLLFMLHHCRGIHGTHLDL